MKHSMHAFFVALGCLVAGWSAGCGGGMPKEPVVYVAMDGNDEWSGRLPEPNRRGSDGPFATLERARDAVRDMKKSGLWDNKSITVVLRGGIYDIDNTLKLDGADSGTVETPVVWRSMGGETVRLSGGRAVDGFTGVTDAAVLERLDESARGKVLQADLETLGISDFGDIDPRSGRRMELFFKGRFMTIARYPNEGWLTITDVPQNGDSLVYEGGKPHMRHGIYVGRHYGRIAYDDPRPGSWSSTDDVWVHGYWTWDWSDQYMPVDRVDTAAMELYPRPPHHGYGYTKGQRFYFLNVLEELDSPGEWYVDRKSGILYFWPPSDIGPGDVVVSLFEREMISLTKTSNVVFRGLTFESSRAGAVSMEDCEGVTVAGCTFTNLGHWVVTVKDGSSCGVQSCDIHDVAGGGVVLGGGDLRTLTPAGNFAVNNHIHDFAIRLKTYQPAVQVTGVGNRVAHNLIHDAPHTGIFCVTSNVGNDHVIEYNELYSLAKETGDVGAIYLCARNYTFRGTVIRHNYLHHLFGPGLHGVMGVYLDDFTSGVSVYGNIFYKAGRAAFIGGGRDNTIANNVFVACSPSTHLDARGIGWAKGWFENSGYRQLMEAMNYTEPPYSERYPELLTLLDDEPALPKGNAIVRNVSCRGQWFDLYDGLDFSIVEMTGNVIADPVLVNWHRDNGRRGEYLFGDTEVMGILRDAGNELVEGDPGIRDIDGGDFRLSDDSPAFDHGFEPIPVERIGLYVDEYRSALPPRPPLD